MTSRRDTVRALAGIAALPFARKLGLYDLSEIGRRAHALAESPDSAPLRALSAAEFETVTQAAERIIPRTNTPGATDANVASFIDVMLADWYERNERDRFKVGLADLDTRANSRFARTFSKSTRAQQVQLLETLDSELQAQRQSSATNADDNWFAMLKHLTIWGFYTSRVGIEQELKQQVIAGHYDGNAPY
jgi:hypothetical protein